MIKNYNDFLKTLLNAGFSLGGGNDEGIYVIVSRGWNEEPQGGSPIHWHTGDPETDPWEWRMRVLNERNDIAYSKFFFKKSGYITREWYPYFLAARREGLTFDEADDRGMVSHFARRIYDVVVAGGCVPLHDIKARGGFAKEDKSAFDRALVELQMKMFLTMCGSQLKMPMQGWASTEFCTIEKFFGEDILDESAKINKEDAFEKIHGQVLKLNPLAKDAKIRKFTAG